MLLSAVEPPEEGSGVKLLATSTHLPIKKPITKNYLLKTSVRYAIEIHIQRHRSPFVTPCELLHLPIKRQFVLK
jgi:hypothetical protein